MPLHLRREITRLKTHVLALSAQVEENVQRAVRSLQDRDPRLATAVIESDSEIDDAEVDIEEDCLKILALHQPVAIDLRFIVAVLKLNSDLERIGDLAVNVAERSLFLADQPPVDLPMLIPEMADRAQAMLKRALEGLINMDAGVAREVRLSDDKVDSLHREMHRLMKDSIRDQPDEMERRISHLDISRHLERIADHATNIAEDVIYMIEGRIVRHREG